MAKKEPKKSKNSHYWSKIAEKILRIVENS
jgi:hypothetical protein